MTEDRAPVSSVRVATPEIAVTPAAVLRIDRIVLNVSDLETASAFYRDALNFRRAPEAASDSTVDSAVLRLGRQDLELRVSGGRPYPEPRAANDPWFQHFAIAVSDMDQAYRRLSQYAQQPISEGGPQRLPPSTGSVTAYKFRDPDGHPLELSYIPGSAWLSQARGRNDEPCLGIDHSALAVSDLDASIAFYRDRLDFSLAGESLNQGCEQDRLDGLARVRVDIRSLATAEGGPHIELLHYLSPRPARMRDPVDPEDIAATHLIVRMAAAGPADAPRLLQDPDGHWLEVAAP
jgi:catechol 2,3-dioxygenase-like lactoylglutathione lyase family enzyme